MTWIKALNGNVFEVPDTLEDTLVAQGHEAFASEGEAREGKRHAAKPTGSKARAAEPTE